MAHRSSSAALHAARTILKDFDLEVIPPEQLVSGRIPNLQATEACISVIIDYATNVHHIVALRPELRHWQEQLQISIPDNHLASQLVTYLQKLLTAYEMLPKRLPTDKTTVTLETPREFGRVPLESVLLSKPSTEVARFLFHYYTVTPKKGVADSVLDRIRVAKLAEMSLNITRTMGVVELAQKSKARLLKGDATLTEIRKSFRALGILLEYFPNYAEREEELILL